MNDKQNGTNNEKILDNILRNLNMLEKALDRLKRKNWHHESQYPESIVLIGLLFSSIRSWAKENRAFCNVALFAWLLGAAAERIGKLICRLADECVPANGKRKEKKGRWERERENILKSLRTMADSLAERIESLKPSQTVVGSAIEEALSASFERCEAQPTQIKGERSISKRGSKTIVFPYTDEAGYVRLVNDGKRFKIEVVEKLPELGRLLGHKPGCEGGEGYCMKGFRRNPRKTAMRGGKRETFPVRMVQCLGCRERFSVLPSFLPREKNFCMAIIGETVREVCLFCQSVRGAFEATALSGGKLKSVQTIMNWIKWMGFLHPARILTGAGVAGSGYFQEDEGFEKEPDLRTYSLAMVDSKSMLVWHMDYLDRVDEKTLRDSFEKFVERIDFKVCGVTKDKWKASTNALKSVFRRIWIGFCHRHFFKKLWGALSEWSRQTGKDKSEVKRIYDLVKVILETADSQTRLKVQIEMAREEAFKHPLVCPTIEELKKNAVHYTVWKRRRGIKKTTSLVDNFLKIVKRKLRQAESFRDRKCTSYFLRALANVRNFVPFMPGSKNSGKSPFMLAGGETFGLPWIEVMNVHNAFLFAQE